MNKLKSYALSAVLTAVYAVIAQISIPFPVVPLTLQCFAIALGGYVLGWRSALISTVLYIGIGAAGLPVFSGFRGGVEALLGPTGGFIWGFIALSALCGIGKYQKRPVAFTLGLLGVVLCNVFGALQFAMVGGGSIKAFLIPCIPYVLKDLLLLWVAINVSSPISASIFKKR